MVTQTSPHYLRTLDHLAANTLLTEREVAESSAPQLGSRPLSFQDLPKLPHVGRDLGGEVDKLLLTHMVSPWRPVVAR
jgi:hypothetical protein